MARRILKPQSERTGNPGFPSPDPCRREPLPARRVATFRVGEAVPDAEYVRMVVPAGTDAAAADAAEAEARRLAVAVKVVREPDDRVAVPAVLRDLLHGLPRPEARQRTLRQVCEERLHRAEGVGDRRLLGDALDQLLTAQGL